jgi:hypothetical protein
VAFFLASAEFADEIHQLFLQRTRLCLWMGTVFFLLFALLDFLCCRPWFAWDAPGASGSPRYCWPRPCSSAP